MVRFHVRRTRSDAGPFSKRSWLPPTTGLRDWRSQMTRDELARFESAAGLLLDDLGYERGSSGDVTAAITDHVARIRDSFTAAVRARGARLPNQWQAG